MTAKERMRLARGASVPDRVEEASAGELVYWKNGDKTLFPPDDLPWHYPACERATPEVSSFNPECIPEEVDFIPVSQGLDFPVDPEHRLLRRLAHARGKCPSPSR